MLLIKLSKCTYFRFTGIMYQICPPPILGSKFTVAHQVQRHILGISNVAVVASIMHSASLRDLGRCILQTPVADVVYKRHSWGMRTIRSDSLVLPPHLNQRRTLRRQPHLTAGNCIENRQARKKHPEIANLRQAAILIEFCRKDGWPRKNLTRTAYRNTSLTHVYRIIMSTHHHHHHHHRSHREHLECTISASSRIWGTWVSR